MQRKSILCDLRVCDFGPQGGGISRGFVTISFNSQDIVGFEPAHGRNAKVKLPDVGYDEQVCRDSANQRLYRNGVADVFDFERVLITNDCL